VDEESKTNVYDEVTSPKQKHDIIDYALIVSFGIVLILICALVWTGREVPGNIESMLYMLATSLGFKKAVPSVNGKK